MGRQLDLFSIHDETGPGLIIWHPKGSRTRGIVEDFWREQHRLHGYELVYTPHIGRASLWETSGHLGFYKENMYAAIEMEGHDYYLKPMNCPFHVMYYQNDLRSYRDLPMRIGELGTVYRYERGGVVQGLLRVRGMTQDDAHIFCRPDQVADEVNGVLDLTFFLLGSFGFSDYDVMLSTKPEKAVGGDDQWELATESLRKTLVERGIDYQMDEGGGAFYGPKIDIHIRDAIGRLWQITTVQFDFNLPERFGLTYIGEDGKEHRPYMVHRALLGTMERFMGLLIEHYAGAFPRVAGAGAGRRNPDSRPSRRVRARGKGPVGSRERARRRRRRERPHERQDSQRPSCRKYRTCWLSETERSRQGRPPCGCGRGTTSARFRSTRSLCASPTRSRRRRSPLSVSLPRPTGERLSEPNQLLQRPDLSRRV